MCKARNIHLTITKDIGEFKKEWDLVFIPTEYIPPSYFPNSKCIMYGPQNFVFADGVWKRGQAFFPPHCFYTLLSDWVIDVQNEFGGLSMTPKSIPFAVDTEVFQPKELPKQYDCFVYFKNRHSSELETVLKELEKKGLSYKVITYGSYKEEEYIQTLHTSKFGIWLGRHESQGFALEEALSCNVPLLVWDCTSMFQEYSNDSPFYKEYKGRYALKATAIPYWDSTCGITFTKEEDLSFSLQTMLENYKIFHPREYIVKTLSPDACIERLLKEIDKVKQNE